MLFLKFRGDFNKGLRLIIPIRIKFKQKYRTLMEAISSCYKFSPTDKQNELVDLLKSKSELLAEMYLGALLVLQQVNNPQRYVQSSHSLRELLEKFPKYFGGVKINTRSSENNKLLSLVVGEYRPGIFAEKDIDLEDKLGEKIRRNARKISKLVIARSATPSRMGEFLNAVRNLDSAGELLPQFLDREIGEKYKNLRNYYLAIAHHNKTINDKNDIQEFSENLSDLEDFFEEIISPKAVESDLTIDALIKEIESDA